MIEPSVNMSEFQRIYRKEYTVWLAKFSVN